MTRRFRRPNLLSLRSGGNEDPVADVGRMLRMDAWRPNRTGKAERVEGRKDGSTGAGKRKAEESVSDPRNRNGSQRQGWREKVECATRIITARVSGVAKLRATAEPLMDWSGNESTADPRTR